MLKFLGKKGRTLVILILLGALLGIILFLNKILFPFLLASFLAYVLAPVIDNLHERKFRSHSISRGGAVLLVYFIILVVLIGGGRGPINEAHYFVIHKLTTIRRACP